MGNNAHKFRTVVNNVTDEELAVAVATAWLKDEIEEVDFAQVNTTSSSEFNTEVQFIARLSKGETQQIKQSDTFEYLKKT